jgi:hypothetical protein
MLGKLKNWLFKRSSGAKSPPPAAQRKTAAPVPTRARPDARPVAAKKVPRPNPDFVETDEDLSGQIETEGPGKNVLIRNKFLREDTGTHETLKILDDSIVDSGEKTGIDPYNTGGFDRSKNWDKRFGK